MTLNIDDIRASILENIQKLEHEDILAQEQRQIVSLDQQAVGRVSRIDAIQQQAMALAQSERRKTSIKELTNTLLRLDEVSFGLCIDCEEPINSARIKTNPSVQLCIECQRG